MPEMPLSFPGAPSEFDCFVYPLPFPRRPILPASMGSAEIDRGGENANTIAFQRRKAQEYAANFSPNKIIARTHDKRDDFHVSILPQIVMDESLEEITAESSSCFERNSSRKRKRLRSGSATTQDFTQDDDLFTKIASLIKHQIEDALSSNLLPLISVLRSREEDEQKHREQMLALEEQKLALKRDKLLFERRRGAKRPRSSRSSNCPLQLRKTENSTLL